MNGDGWASTDVQSIRISIILLHFLLIPSFLLFPYLRSAGKQCILTITRPNGVSRSYITKPEFIRKSEAKACAATIALEMGAIDFILYGSKSPGKKKILLAPVHGSASDSELGKGKGKEVDESNESSEHLQIVSCCEQWRAGRVVPKYTFYDGGKMNDSKKDLVKDFPC